MPHVRSRTLVGGSDTCASEKEASPVAVAAQRGPGAFAGQHAPTVCCPWADPASARRKAQRSVPGSKSLRLGPRHSESLITQASVRPLASRLWPTSGWQSPHVRRVATGLVRLAAARPRRAVAPCVAPGDGGQETVLRWRHHLGQRCHGWCGAPRSGPVRPRNGALPAWRLRAPHRLMRCGLVGGVTVLPGTSPSKCRRPE